MWHATTKMIDAQSFGNLKRAALGSSGRCLCIFPGQGAITQWIARSSAGSWVVAVNSPLTCVHVHVQSFAVAVAPAAR